MLEIRCPHCTHPQFFLSNDQKCSCCQRVLIPFTGQDEIPNHPNEGRSEENTSDARAEDRFWKARADEFGFSLDRLNLLDPNDAFAHSDIGLRTKTNSAAPDEDRRTERLSQNTEFQVTCKETQTPDFIDFVNDDPQWMANHRLEVVVDLPIERASSEEMSIPVIIKTQLKGVKVAVWLRRDSHVGNGHSDYCYTTEMPCKVALKLDENDRQFELCIQPANAQNWLWTVTVPVLRRAEVDKIPRYYVLDQSRCVNGDGPYLEGYTNIQINLADQPPPQATSRQFGFILYPTPRKKRTRRVQPTICNRRKRAVSEFTLQIQSDRWHIHGGSFLTFGRDKPLPDRDNTNDISFRPHQDVEILKQVSQVHGIFELQGHTIRYRHSDIGRNQQKRTLVLLPNATEHTVRQPEEFIVPDPYQKVGFWPRLSIPRAESQILEVQAWRTMLSDVHHYPLHVPEDVDEHRLPQSRNILGGILLSIVAPKMHTVSRHCLIAKSMVIGASNAAQIQCQGPDIRSAHAYIHWIDQHLWLEPCNPTCHVEVNGKRLHRDHLSPLLEGTSVVLGSNTTLEILPFG
jgi:hypothetical protein